MNPAIGAADIGVTEVPMRFILVAATAAKFQENTPYVIYVTTINVQKEAERTGQVIARRCLSSKGFMIKNCR